MKKLIIFFALVGFSALAQQGSPGQGSYNQNSIGQNYNRVWYVGTNGNDSSAGTLTAPKRTLLNAYNLAVRGDLIYAYQGCYTNADFYKDGVDFYFDHNTWVNVDTNGVTGYVFGDTDFVTPATNISFNIYGHVSFTNKAGGGFLKYSGPRTKVNVFGDTFIGDNAVGAVFWMHPNSYVGQNAYTPGPYDEELNVTANYVEGWLWVGDCAAVFNVNTYSNVFFFLDRDITNYHRPHVFNGACILNSTINCQVSYPSTAVFNVPYISGASTTSPAGIVNIFTGYIAGCKYGTLVFNNTLFVQNSAGNNFAVGRADIAGYANADTNHAGRIIFNNCSVLNKTVNTNWVVGSWPGSAGTNQGRILVNGNFNASGGMIDPLVVKDGAGVITTNVTTLSNYIFLPQ